MRWNQRWPTYQDLCKLTTGSSKELGLHSQTVQAVCEQYATRRQQFKKRTLRWRGRRSPGWIPFEASGVKVVDDTVIYAGHTFRFWKSRELPGPVNCGSFSQDSRGRWYVNFGVEVADEALTTGTKQVGIDLGLKTLATCSEGRKIEAPRWYRNQQRRIAEHQRKKRSRQARNLHAKIANRRQDFLHKESDRLTKECELIVIGDVCSSKLSKTKMAQSVNDAGWALFKNLLSYKAMARKVVYREVSERLSTQTCSCDVKPPKSLFHKREIQDETCRSLDSSRPPHAALATGRYEAGETMHPIPERVSGIREEEANLQAPCG